MIKLLKFYFCEDLMAEVEKRLLMSDSIGYGLESELIDDMSDCMAIMDVAKYVQYCSLSRYKLLEHVIYNICYDFLRNSGVADLFAKVRKEARNKWLKYDFNDKEVLYIIKNSSDKGHLKYYIDFLSETLKHESDSYNEKQLSFIKDCLKRLTKKFSKLNGGDK